MYESVHLPEGVQRCVQDAPLVGIVLRILRDLDAVNIIDVFRALGSFRHAGKISTCDNRVGGG